MWNYLLGMWIFATGCVGVLITVWNYLLGMYEYLLLGSRFPYYCMYVSLLMCGYLLGMYGGLGVLITDVGYVIFIFTDVGLMLGMVD